MEVGNKLLATVALTLGKKIPSSQHRRMDGSKYELDIVKERKISLHFLD
jgi:hypothetical protein